MAKKGIEPCFSKVCDWEGNVEKFTLDLLLSGSNYDTLKELVLICRQNFGIVEKTITRFRTKEQLFARGCSSKWDLIAQS